MQQNPKDIILQVLTFIGYEDNKDAYADEFIQNCEKQALLDLLTALPQDKQETLKQRLAQTQKQEQQAIIAEYVTPDQYKEALQKASATAFEGLVKEVMPTLSTEQSGNLQAYLNSLHFSNKHTPLVESV